MPDVRMPDGTVIRNVPEGTTKSELRRRLGAANQQATSQAPTVSPGVQQPTQQTPLQQFGLQGFGGTVANLTPQGQQMTPQPQQGGGQSMQAFGQGAASRFLGNVANVPDLVANLAARGGNKLLRPVQRAGEAAAAVATGDPGQFQQNPQVFNPPDLGVDFVPGPEGEDLQGFLQKSGEFVAASLTGDFSQFSEDTVEQQKALNKRLAEENPIAFGAGTVSGDVLTLITGRSPIAKSRGRAQMASRVMGERIARESARGTKNIALAPNVSSALKTITPRSKGFVNLMNRAGRSAETGVESATLSILNGEADPAESFGFAAGTQAAGSLFLGGMAGLFSGSLPSAALKLGASAAAVGSLLQLFKESTPGGRDFSLESLESGFSKVALGIGLGATAGLAGLGRVTSRFPVRALPDVADAISALPRGATLSVINEALEDPATDTVVQKLSTDPLYFGETARRRLERAMKNENVKMGTVIEDLMQNQQFRRKFEEIEM